MSIFGQLDAETIHSNPFFIEKGEYTAEVTKAYFKEAADKPRQLVIEYTVTNEDSQYVDQKAYHYFTLVASDMTAEKFALLPADEQKNIRRSNSALKRTLCGDDGNSSKNGLGVSADDLNDKDWNPETLVGTKIDMGIGNYGSDGVNVRWVNIQSE